jgi:hypothetical protein
MKTFTSRAFFQLTKIGFAFLHVRTAVIFSSMTLFCLAGFTPQAFAVDAFIASKGATAICNGTNTTIQVIISDSQGPYTVVYSNGTSNFTVSN